ncbi:flagellar hook protein FlgE [Roseibium sp.]|uniref:flagellar hook protein FlgE n=1 Tax=Roseibium sp. TaxID=1936156 RepID=UPI003D0E0E27
MGIYGAINSAVSGLSAQATALENISGNVANSQTVGFKRLDTTFSDLVSGGGSTQADQVSGTTYSTSRATNTVAGDISSSQVDTYMAINGSGYFVVTQAADFVDGSTTFADDTFYTRAGDFEVNKEGYFVNQSGYYLKGFPLDPTTGNPVGDNPSVIQINSQPLAASATTTVNYQASLPRVPATTNYDANTANSELLNNGTNGAPGPNLGATEIGDTGTLEADFLASSISGGAVTAYNSNGSEVPLNVRWAKVDNTAGAEVWSMYIDTGGETGTSYYKVGDVTFDGTGQVTTIATTGATAGLGVTTDGTSNFTLDTITVGGVTAGTAANAADSITISFANGSLTQFADPDGIATSVNLNQNGYAAGELTNIAIDESGRVIASYSNNQTRALYEIPLATFRAEQNLRRVDGAGFAATSDSGDADLSGGGAVISNALELSNADIADEFSKLIITQQAYSANSRIVTSADEMLDSALNMVR